jgi:hypothetical protein
MQSYAEPVVVHHDVQILSAGAKGILQQKAKNLLRENGGHIDLDRRGLNLS